MVDVSFELTTTVLFVWALVRWATGKRLTNRLPKLILVTVVGRGGEKPAM